MIVIDQVDKSYGGVSVLKAATCEIPTDGFTFVMGPSGSGKSTLLRLLSMVETPTRGRIAINVGGRVFSSDSSARPWPELTCVFQRQFLWPHLTISENIALPLRANKRTDISERVSRVINLFDMSSFADRYPNEISGGQAQRAALARALALEPRVILIDEAHSGLDIEQQVTLNEHLLALRSTGTALIVVSHSLDFTLQYADRIIIVEDGRLQISNSLEGLQNMDSPFVRRVLSFNLERHVRER
jgi:ABC-type Fe3+/spermidine/putrescine transport system ATPase subunit